MKAGTARKTAALAVTGALTAAIVLTGTLAWTSISQKATNVKVVEVNPGGRLHDDFDGENKDVYVENFTDPDDASSAPIFVRVRLREYMETGDDAGVKTVEEGTTRQATPLVAGTDINKPTEWTIHIPGDAADLFHDYWLWGTGGGTVYMPTFNKNKDSLAADVNGSYEGTTVGDATHFDDYVAYADGDKKGGDAYYDADDNDTDEGESGVENVNYTTASETHTAAETQSAAVYTMEQWQAMGSPIGEYWVWDADGWAYWASPLMPGTATGCLLTKVTDRGTAGEKCYYGIYVEGQFASAGDWGTAADSTSDAEATGFYIDGLTDNALALLNQLIEIQS